MNSMNKSIQQSWSKPAKLFKKVALGLAVSTALVNSAYAVEPLSVSGNRILTGGQEGKAFAGPSLFWSNTGWGAEGYWNGGTVSHFKNNWNAKLIRAAMGVEGGGGAADDFWTNVNRVKTVVDAAIENDMYVIVDFHTHELPNHMQKAKEFFSHMAEHYGHHDNIIWEVYNEPLKVSWSNDIKPYAEEIIGEIRKHDPDNLVIVGTPTWSQRVDEASEDPITKYDNIAYTIHFYANFEWHQQNLIDIAQKALDNGIALMATEWGTVNADGDGPVSYEWTNKWMDFLATNGISHANWSVHNKPEGASMFWGNGLGNLTESGNLVKEVVSDWQQRVDKLYKPGNLTGGTITPDPVKPDPTKPPEECEDQGDITPSDGQNVAALSVEGNQVLIGGEKGSLAGPSLFWSSDGWGGERFYNAETVKNAKNEMGATLIRAAMGAESEGKGGYLENKDNADKVRAVVDAAVDNEMYVIIDWHSHDAEKSTNEAKEFFSQMAREYGHLNNVIYEVYNEPVNQSWNEVKGYAEQVIAAIRAEDPDNLIVVGTPKWSQNVDDASRNQINGKNIAYVLHFYAGTHKGELRAKAQTALNNGAALFATEWGTVNANGDGGVNHGETDAWMQFFKQNNISHAGWALNDKAEGSSVFKCNNVNQFKDCEDPIDNKWSMLTESGSKQKDIYNNWPRPSGIKNGTGGTVSGGNGSCDIKIPVEPADPVTIPAKIEAEKYASMSGIQLEDTSDNGGGENVGWTDAGDTISYAIEVPATGEYTINFRVASKDGSSFSVSTQGQSLTNVNVPNTGDWQNWETVSKDVQLSAGAQTLEIKAIGGGWNINWIDIQGDTPAQPDRDNDGVLDSVDNCPDDANSNQADNDGDGEGNVCDDTPNGLITINPDTDGDGILDVNDNCPAIANPGQWDKDNDNIGNECDDDLDGDGFKNTWEVNNGYNAWNANSPGPQGGPDADGDGIRDDLDNCKNIPNKGQWDRDRDNIGNECDNDIDGDGYSNDVEIAANTKPWNKNDFPINITPSDSDGDSVPNHMDNCATIANVGQWDKDRDGEGNACDSDIDGDGFSNAAEEAAGSNPWKASSTPNVVIIDSDNDGIKDSLDNCPSIANAGQFDLDSDGLGNECDDDIDGDGCSNANEDTAGTKKWDPISVPLSCGSIAIEDADNDGVADDLDNCVNIANSNQANMDNDASGDACDADIDGDGFSNQIEEAKGTDPRDPADKPVPVVGKAEPHQVNPFDGADFYINPDYAELIQGSQDQVSDSSLKAAMEVVKTVPTAVWLDRIEAIHGGPNNGNRKSLKDHFDLAMSQKRADVPMVFKLVIYNLPNRDCSALASNGTLQEEAGLERYKTEYIDVVADIAKDYPGLRVVAVIEPDSLPNMITNDDLPACKHVADERFYERGIQHALSVFSKMDNVYTYLDIGHSGWLGWATNMTPAVNYYTKVVKGVDGGDMSVVDGVISNVSGYTPTEEPHMPSALFNFTNGQTIRGPGFFDWNDHLGEKTYLEALHDEFTSAGFPNDFAMVIDTSRNGWGGPNHDKVVDDSITDRDEFVDEYRIDQRSHRGNWCNQDFAGMGERPQNKPFGESSVIEAFVWIKPPGESDGTSDSTQTEIDIEGKSFDKMCSPGYKDQRRNGGKVTQAMSGAPAAGHWFHEQFKMLVENAHPKL